MYPEVSPVKTTIANNVSRDWPKAKRSIRAGVRECFGSAMLSRREALFSRDKIVAEHSGFLGSPKQVMVLKTIRFVARLLPARLPEIVYTVLLRPRPLRRMANRILLKVIPPEVKVDGLTLFLNPSDPVLSSAMAFGIYENHEADVFRRYCKEGATVVDIGANVGLYTVIAAARVGSR